MLTVETDRREQNISTHLRAGWFSYIGLSTNRQIGHFRYPTHKVEWASDLLHTNN